MAIKISQLPEQAAPLEDDVLPIVQGITTFKATIAAVIGVFLPTTLVAGDTGKLAFVDGAAGDYVLTAAPTAIGQTLRWTGTAWAPGALDLADPDSIAGVLPVEHGGTGLAAPVTDGVMLFAASGAWVKTTTVKSDGTSLSFGADPATGATLNFSDNSIAEAKRTGGTDATLWSWASDDLELGSNTIDDLILNTGSARSIFARVDNSTRLTIAAALTTSVNPVGIGSNPASSGALRLTNNETINSKNSTGTSIALIGTSTDAVAIGSSSASISGIFYSFGGAGTHSFSVGGLNVATLGATALTLPLGGTAATSGSMRVASGFSLVGKDSTGLLDITGMQIRTDNFVSIGDGADGAGVLLNAPAGGEIRMRISGTTIEYRFFSDRADFTDNELRFGTNPATGAKVNTPNNVAVIESRNSTNDGDLNILFVTNTNQLVFGLNDTALTTPAQVILNTATGGEVAFRHNNVSAIRVFETSARLSSGVVLQFNTTQTAGLINVLNNVTALSGRDAAASNNIALVTWNGSNQLVLGQDTILAGVIARASSYFRVFIAGSATENLSVDAEKIFIKNGGNTAGDPVGGGYQYAEGGAGKWHGSSGTVTTFGPAEPHCPRCGSDFVHEWHNARFGGRHAVCVKCLVGALERHGVSPDEWVIERAA
jgi:hypothetical protein